MQIENSRDIFASPAYSSTGRNLGQLAAKENQAGGLESEQKLNVADFSEMFKGKSLSYGDTHKDQFCNNENTAANGISIEEELEEIQLVWEHLELARVYTEMKLNQLKEEGKANKTTDLLRFLSMIYIKLGDASCYQENFEEALIDYENALNLRKQKEDHYYSREVAES